VSATLDALALKHPDLASAAATLRALATALPELELPSGVPHLEAAEARLAEGIAALESEPLLSGAALLSNVRVLARALESTGAVYPNTVAELLERNLDAAGADDLAEAAQFGAWHTVGMLAQRIGLDPDATITLADYAARPALRAGARATYQLLARSHWSRGTCPACGAAPLLGELRSGGTSGAAEHERVLRCGRCAAAWSFPRLCCVSCGETNHRQLAYLHETGEDSFRRAEICSTCRSYIKAIAVLAPLSTIELLGADLATAALDRAAVERGFHR
jgi:formate dehydrogenase accessory protein FdhE